MKNRSTTPVLTNLVGVHQRNIKTKFEANLYISLRKEVENIILYSDIVIHCIKYACSVTH